MPMNQIMNNKTNLTDEPNDSQQPSLENKLILLAKPIYEFYPSFDSQSFLTLISVICKRYNVDNIVQQLEIEFIRPNVYRLNTFTDFIALLTAEMKDANSKKDILSLFSNITTKIHNLLQHTKEQAVIDNHLHYELHADNNWQYYQDMISIITNEIATYTDANKVEKPDGLFTQATLGEHTDDNIYSLSPTQGLAFLNRNPYRFFSEKILGIKAVNDWDENVNTRLYGIIIHEIMYAYANACKTKPYENINKQLFLNIAMQILFKYRVDNNIVLQDKLDILSNLAVEIERKAKQQSLEVLCETQLSHIFNKVKITAKADRIEINHKTQEIYIYDYKTGQLPTYQQELNGEKTQLAIIAILLLQQGQYKNYHIKKMQYICLSGRDKDTKLSNIDITAIPEIQDNLLDLIDYFFTNGKPNYDKFIEIKPSSFVFDKTELFIKYLSKISNFITLA